MKKIFKIIICLFFVLLILFVYYYFFAKAKEVENITWGVNFSKEYAVFLGTDWKESYLAILDDLKAKDIKLLVQWNSVEKDKDKLDFSDTDWQISKAKDYGADVIYVLGMKTGRWPECHVPNWADGLDKEKQQQEILDFVEKTVLRYKDEKSIVAWQAENEPFYNFGICPWYDDEFVKKEVELIKSLDPLRPIIVSDTGEQSFWLKPAKIGDIIGITMYRKVWVHITDDLGFYYSFPLPAVSYFDRAQIIKALYGKKVINVELQAEPWVSSVSDNSLLQQGGSMNLDQFRDNINYAKKSGLDTFYLWGAEWWYYMKEKHNDRSIWNEARDLLKI